MNSSLFITRKIAFQNPKGFSAFVIRIAVAAVALSVAVMIVASSLVNGFQTEIRQKVFAFWAHLQIRPYSLSENYETEGVYKFQDFYRHPEKLAGVAHIQVTALKPGLLKTKEDFEGVVLKGVGSDFDWKNFQQHFVKGGVLKDDSTYNQRGILVSKLTADRLLLDTGQKVIVNFLEKEMKARAFRIRGIYETGIEEFDKEIAIVDIATIQELNNWGSDTVGGFELILSEGNLFKSRSRAYFLSLFGGLLSEEKFAELNRDPIDETATRLNYAIGNERLEVVSLKELRPGMFDWLDLQTMNELIILLLMIVVAIINMITTLLILILDRSTMIGMLKALGGNERLLHHIFLWYAGIIIGFGLLIGNAVGLGLCGLQQYFQIISLPQESYYLKYAPIAIQPLWIIGINVGTLLLCLVLLQIPLLLIRKISVIKALRFQ